MELPPLPILRSNSVMDWYLWHFRPWGPTGDLVVGTNSKVLLKPCALSRVWLFSYLDALDKCSALIVLKQGLGGIEDLNPERLPGLPGQWLGTASPFIRSLQSSCVLFALAAELKIPGRISSWTRLGRLGSPRMRSVVSSAVNLENEGKYSF